MQRAADGDARQENAGKSGGGDLAGPGEITREEPQDGKRVHAATGEVKGPDGHVIALTDENPELRAIADAIESEYDGIVTISVRFGWFRADWAHLPPGTVAAHITANDEESLRRQLDAALRRRETGR